MTLYSFYYYYFLMRNKTDVIYFRPVTNSYLIKFYLLKSVWFILTQKSKSLRLLQKRIKPILNLTQPDPHLPRPPFLLRNRHQFHQRRCLYYSKLAQIISSGFIHFHGNHMFRHQLLTPLRMQILSFALLPLLPIHVIDHKPIDRSIPRLVIFTTPTTPSIPRASFATTHLPPILFASRQRNTPLLLMVDRSHKIFLVLLIPNERNSPHLTAN